MLFPAEEAAIARAVAKRRSEFATGRACARAALAKLGLPPVPIVPGLRGAPQWPAGVTGSITHCAGYRASAVARLTDVAGIGLDAEPNDALPGGVLERIAVAQEQAWLPGWPPRCPAWPGTGCCSAPRSRCTRPGSRSPGAGSASSRRPSPSSRRPAPSPRGCWSPPRPSTAAGWTGFAGRWLARDGLVLTAVTVPA